MNNSGTSMHKNKEERAYLARLAAMNVMFEAARSGKAAIGYAQRARSCDELLSAFLNELKAH